MTRRRWGERAASLRDSQVAGRFGVASRASSESREVPLRRSTGGQPRHADGYDERLVVRRQCGAEPVTGPRHGVEDDGHRRILFPSPLVDHRALDGGRIDSDRDDGD